jgi:hypothetical protein
MKVSLNSQRKSKNVIDKRKPKDSDLFQATDVRQDHMRQVYANDISKDITRLSNAVVRADPMRAKGKGMNKLRSPAGQTPQTTFSKKGDRPVKFLKHTTTRQK